MKSYSFYFNASDWLASQAVKEMSLAERGAYIGLLSYAWKAERPGTLPVAEDRVRRLAEMTPAEWEVSGPVLLEKFPLSECKTYRYNDRLMQEVAKEQAKSVKAKKSADVRWQSERNANASKPDANASQTACERNAQEQEQETTNVVVAATPAPLPAKKSKQQIAALLTDPDDLQSVEDSPLFKPSLSTIILSLYPKADVERYRAQIAAKSEGLMLTSNQWRNRIINFLNLDFEAGHLLMAPVIIPNQIASNAARPVVSSGIPNRESYLKPQTAGQYTGNIN